MSAKVTVVGSLNMDLIVRSSHMPKPGETIIGGTFHTAPGGKGANQAVAAARFGGQVSLVGRVGEDAFGAELLQNLRADGVSDRYVIQENAAATGVALIVVDQAGENSIVVAPGANMSLTPEDVEASLPAIAEAEVLLLQLENPIEAVQRAAEIARANQVKVVLNPAPARQVPRQLLSLVDILVPNESETALLTGIPISNEEELEAAATQLLDLGVGAIVLTLGSRGALLAQKEASQRYPAFKVNPVDTTAAGDTFLGSFGVALAEGKTLAEAVSWGNAAGALATTRLGAQPSIPTRREVEAFLARAELRA